MSYLFSDDDRKPKDVKWMTLPECVEWNVVRNFSEFRLAIELHGVPKLISFDHDLHEEHYQEYAKAIEENRALNYKNFTHKTGYECAIWLVSYCLKNRCQIPDVLVHSLNHFGAYNIRQLILAAKNF